MPNIPNGRETSPRIPFPLAGLLNGPADCLFTRWFTAAYLGVIDLGAIRL